MASLDDQHEKITTGSAKVGIIELGYVGLPLAITMLKNYEVVGYDNSKEVIESLKEGNLVIPESTVPPLTSQNIMTPVLEKNELEVGENRI